MGAGNNMHKIRQAVYLCMVLGLLSACSSVDTEEQQRHKSVCDYFVQHAQGEWRNASLSTIYNVNPKMGKNQTDGLRNLVSEMVFCQKHVLTGENNEEKRSALEAIRDKIVQHYLTHESAVFRERTNGKEWCGTRSLADVAVFYKHPMRNCIYRHADNSIIVTQATPKGVLASSYTDTARTIFVSNGLDIDSNLVDYDRLPDGFFEYTGAYSYMSLLGQKTVHSFKRIKGNPLDGLLFYGIISAKAEEMHNQQYQIPQKQNWPF